MRSVGLALIHHPVLGRNGDVLTTTLTNLDVHDISRSVRAYGLEAFYAVHPLASQRLLVQRIVGHWLDGPGGRRIPDRREALGVLRVVETLEQACSQLAGAAGSDEPTELWTTAAASRERPIVTFAEARRQLETDGPPVMLCFGTGWGLAPSLMDQSQLQLEPIAAARDSGFNHLSVRAACAIALDRLFG